MIADIHSRSRLAGYEPDRLFNAGALVVGAGALGQNLAQDLALAGLGEIDIIDFDDFEPHNATRSPLYPTRQEQHQLGLAKAKVVAHKLLPLMTAPSPRVRFAVVPIQLVGGLPIAKADVVFSAVDNMAGRLYLAEKCRLLGRPLVEGGFHGPDYSLALFGTGAEEPCYRCGNPEKLGAFSCGRYAAQVEAEGAIPAIQNSAAVLAGLLAECGIQWLHGQAPLLGKRVYGSIREATSRTVSLSRDRDCPGDHRAYAGEPFEVAVGPNDPLHSLLEAVARVVGLAEIRLPEPLVVRSFCTQCHSLAEADCPDWRWLASPRCVDCGGPFQRAQPGRYPCSVDGLRTGEDTEEAEVTCAEVGLPAGATFEVWPDEGEPRLFRMSGGMEELTEAVELTSQSTCPIAAVAGSHGWAHR